ncbi:hypothetical protein [Streptomyces tritici]|uniref:hypothetical protein n=1 Tax=Streptomyces tritici TaxID=2054410 RepID=UPI003AF059CE
MVVDIAARTVEPASGGALDYDYVIYAVGSTGATPAVPGAAEFPHDPNEFEGARRLRDRLGEVPSDARHAWAGAAPSGWSPARTTAR